MFVGTLLTWKKENKVMKRQIATRLMFHSNKEARQSSRDCSRICNAMQNCTRCWFSKRRNLQTSLNSVSLTDSCSSLAASCWMSALKNEGKGMPAVSQLYCVKLSISFWKAEVSTDDGDGSPTKDCEWVNAQNTALIGCGCCLCLQKYQKKYPNEVYALLMQLGAAGSRSCPCENGSRWCWRSLQS